MNVYAYLRVSTDQQVESGAGLEAQLIACRKWAEAQKIEIKEIFIEGGVSGAAELNKRPELLKAIDALKPNDILLVSKRDRLGRDVFKVATIEQMVKRKKAIIISAAGEGTGKNDYHSVFIKNLTDALAMFEKGQIVQRIKDAFEAKKARGERVGYIPFGYKLADDRKHIEKDEHEQSILKQIQDLKASGLSIRKIAQEMNARGVFNRGNSKWTHSAIHRIMSRAA